MPHTPVPAISGSLPEVNLRGLRDALAVRLAQGVRLGCRQTLTVDIVTRIRDAHRAGAGWSALACQLNEEGYQLRTVGASGTPRMYEPSCSLQRQRHDKS